MLSHSCQSEVAQLCPTLSDPMDCSLPGSSVHAVFQARILEWVAISFYRGFSGPKDQTRVSHTASRLFTICKSKTKLTVIRMAIIKKWRGFSSSSAGKESTYNAGDPGLIPGSRRSTGDRIGYPLQYSWASLVAQLVKNSLAMRDTWLDLRVGKIPWRREWWLPFPVFWSGEFHGLYNPWGHKEADTTEQLSFQKKWNNW